MKPDVRDPNCPTRAVLDRIGDRWTALIVLVLLDRPRRFTDLRTEIGGISPKVLSETLRRLERDGIVTRIAHAETPRRVEYELTPLGRSLERPILLITSWAEDNMNRIERARDLFDRRAA